MSPSKGKQDEAHYEKERDYINDCSSRHKLKEDGRGLEEITRGDTKELRNQIDLQ